MPSTALRWSDVHPSPAQPRAPDNGREVVQFSARDGQRLFGDLYRPAAEPFGALLIAPAMAVNRGFYGAFASYLAQHGWLVLVPDYRGVGDSRPPSLRGFKADLRDWAERDLEGALDLLAASAPGVRLCALGHSIGGQLIGLLDAARIDRVLLVAAQSGYAGHWRGAARLRMKALWYVVVPGLSLALDYLPIGRITGSGEDVPAGVALQWARWARSARYMFAELPLRDGSCFASFRGPLRSIAISDDELAPVGSIRWLAEQFRSARSELVELTPARVGVRKIGHFPPFRPAFAHSLWEQFRAFLESTTSP